MALIDSLIADYDAFLFDIDGTLLNARDGVHFGGFRAALKEVWNCERAIESVPYHGNTDIGILRALVALDGVSDEQFRRDLPRAIAVVESSVLANECNANPTLCPQTPRLLAELDRAGKLIAATTGNIEVVGWLKLRAAKLRERFAYGVFSDKLWTRAEIFAAGAAEARKRLGPQARVIFMGDTPNDVLAAQEIGEPVIAVATGRFTREQLLAAGPSHLCLTSCAELFD